MAKLYFLVLFILTFGLGAEVKQILCFGDSITHKGSWVKIVGADPAFETINAGKSGRRAAQARKSLAIYLNKHKDVKRLIMFLGVNDLPALDKRPGDIIVVLCVENMSQVIDLALTVFKPKDIILVAPCTVNPQKMNSVNRRKGYNITVPLLASLEVKYKALALKKKISFLSLLTVVSKEHFIDGLHPDKAGDEEIAKAVLNYLKKWILSCQFLQGIFYFLKIFYLLFFMLEINT